MANKTKSANVEAMKSATNEEANANTPAVEVVAITEEVTPAKSEEQLIEEEKSNATKEVEKYFIDRSKEGNKLDSFGKIDYLTSLIVEEYGEELYSLLHNSEEPASEEEREEMFRDATRRFKTENVDDFIDCGDWDWEASIEDNIEALREHIKEMRE